MSLDLTGLGSVAELVTGVVNRLWPDATEADKAKLTLALAELDAMRAQNVAQTEVNKVEAASDNLFVSGARPAMLWMCVAIFFYSYIFYPTVGIVILLFDAAFVLPKLVVDEPVWNLIFGLLGVSLVAARSYERVKGVTPPGKS